MLYYCMHIHYTCRARKGYISAEDLEYFGDVRHALVLSLKPSYLEGIVSLVDVDCDGKFGLTDLINLVLLWKQHRSR